MMPGAALVIHKQVFPFLNISLYLNNIPLIRELTMENTGSQLLENLQLRIAANIPCIENFTYDITGIPAGKDIKIPLEQLKVNRDFLSRLSETEKAVITITVWQNETKLAAEDMTIAVHPLEYFGGFQVLPELIAAYVTPNHSYVYAIKNKAVDILLKQNLQTAFEGYQSNSPERVLQLMSAIYSAIQSEEIVYSALAPGYEETGQRLRLLDTIRKGKFANCIDLSLLFAACLEAVDLNPVLIIVQGHAFVGCWLHDDKFPETVNDDKTAITKRLSKGIHEMAAIEATSVCKGNKTSFTQALYSGEAQLVESENFLLSVDIKRARTARIRPLPLLTDNTAGLSTEDILGKETHILPETDFNIGTVYTDELLQHKQTLTKQKLWERKLLDLSLRNNLLNLRMTRNMLQLADIDISHLEDTLSEGKSFTIIPNPAAELLRKYNLFTQPLHHSSPLYQLANEELKANRLLTHYHPQDLDTILTYMHRSAKQAIEENGSSTLFLAVGLLKWYDVKTPDQPRFAPVLLVPVELNRRSVNSRFTLKSREEEVMINITLLEFLRQEYQLNLGGLEQLPYDEKGVDVAKVMGMLRRAVMQLKGWDVEEQLVLGNFSFNKLILWKDLVDHSDALLESDMVRSLVAGKPVFDVGDETMAHTDFDAIGAASLTLPIATDVSQMEAVLTAQTGRSYILHGPPGTGKSQTITNMIADALYRGKKVLFVAAKKAALDVVHKRLEQIGLAPFALELHSNKSKKSDVLAQLAKTLETAKLISTVDFEQEARRLDAAKKQISDYVNLLHRQQHWGQSLYDSITALEQYRSLAVKPQPIPTHVIKALDKQWWQQWEDWVPVYQSIAGLVIHPKENPLASLQVKQYTATLQETIGTQVQQLLTALPAYQQAVMALAAAIHFPFALQTKTSQEQFVAMVQAFKNLPDMPLTLVQYLADKDNYEAYEDWHRHFKNYLQAFKNITADYSRDILSADITTLDRQWKQAEQSWFLPKWWNKRSIKKQLSLYKHTPVNNDAAVLQFFSLYRQLREEQATLQQDRYTTVQRALKNLYKEEQTDITDIDLKATMVQRIAAMMLPFGRPALQQWINELQQQQLFYTGDVKGLQPALWQALLDKALHTGQVLQQYQVLTGATIPAGENWLPDTEKFLEQLQQHLPRLKDWMNYVQQTNAGKALQLDWLIHAFETGECTAAAITDCYHYSVHTATAQYVIEAHESLSLFNAGLFESKIEQYKKIAKEFQQLTIQTLRMKLAAQLPNTTVDAMQSSEPGILQRAIRNRGRGMSIRRLFDQLPTLLPRLAPCMLMSPISVAQYFDVNTDHFDLVIFDEASQLPTCEAVSALARAKQAVIVGDPKQMPPTSFFSTNKTDEEDAEIEDLESILDDCLSLSIPSKYLLRHYRSKHESLIAFSNASYYENKLLTFPSADDLNRKVQYHHVPGHYDKGKTRTNSFEADTIVQYIRAHYSDPAKRVYSLGVVTFSQTQQNLVEDKLQALYSKDAQLEQWSSEATEPLFIKNLENVQGDERDIILFSVGYAPDQEGKMSMNFGPLNRNGGWRRLNVAVTRARYEMHVFATLVADQIDLNRTAAEGVAGLKAFLQFAQNGHLALPAKGVQIDNHQLSQVIGQRLQEQGLQVQCDIGTSGFKIDIGVVHPKKEKQYILGILIDGPYYYNARTANDREMVMPGVLKTLGWNLHRIWTMDWYENSDKIVDGIVNKVQQLVQQPALVTGTGIQEPAEENSAGFPAFTAVTEAVPLVPLKKQKPYLAHTLSKIPGAGNDAIYEAQYRQRLVQQVQMLVAMEAPISKNWLYRKILQAWNISRVGTKLEAYLQEIITEMDLTTTRHHQPFYWTAPVAEMDHYRSNETEKRNIEDIAPEEIVVALEEVVAYNLSIDEEELVRYLCRSFGFSKVGKQIDSLLRYAIDMAEKEGKIIREDGRVKISEASHHKV